MKSMVSLLVVDIREKLAISRMKKKRQYISDLENKRIRKRGRIRVNPSWLDPKRRGNDPFRHPDGKTT